MALMMASICQTWAVYCSGLDREGMMSMVYLSSVSFGCARRPQAHCPSRSVSRRLPPYTTFRFEERLLGAGTYRALIRRAAETH